MALRVTWNVPYLLWYFVFAAYMQFPVQPWGGAVTVHEPKVTGIQESIERRRYFPDASVDQTDARNA